MVTKGTFGEVFVLLPLLAEKAYFLTCSRIQKTSVNCDVGLYIFLK